jgi:hypothetical protein
MDDEVIRGATAAHDGKVTWPAPAPKLSAAPAAPKAAPVVVEPLTPQELKTMLEQSRESEDDDCLMCGS